MECFSATPHHAQSQIIPEALISRQRTRVCTLTSLLLTGASPVPSSLPCISSSIVHQQIFGALVDWEGKCRLSQKSAGSWFKNITVSIGASSYVDKSGVRMWTGEAHGRQNSCRSSLHSDVGLFCTYRSPEARCFGRVEG